MEQRMSTKIIAKLGEQCQQLEAFANKCHDSRERLTFFVEAGAFTSALDYEVSALVKCGIGNVVVEQIKKLRQDIVREANKDVNQR